MVSPQPAVHFLAACDAAALADKVFRRICDHGHNANSDSLVRNVVEQVMDRAQHLPSGMQQNIRIDARGQQVSEEQLNDVARRIVERSNGLLKSENVEFRRVR